MIMKPVVLLAILSFAAAVRWHQLEGYNFEHYKKEHGKVYESEEEEASRKEIFEFELQRVKNHNKDGTKTWKEGINRFSDRTREEMKDYKGLHKPTLFSQKQNKREEPVRKSLNGPYPIQVDWRTAGVVTSVKDQGMCGSCWTFATAEIMESYFALASGFLTDLSEQQVLDCTPNPLQCGGTGGCQGGTVELALARIREIGGQSTEWTYPYRSYSGNNFECQNSSISQVVTVNNFTVLPSNQLWPVMDHIARNGPLAISVDASAWSPYETGVFDGCNQTNPDLDHAVVLVGYGVDAANGPYWLVRNSWNPSWGEQGYIRIKREVSTDEVVCGIDITPLDGDGCKNGPPTEKVCGTCGILYDNVFPNVEPIWT